MNSILRSPSARRTSKGFAVYEIMLILACVAVAVAVLLTGYEYVTLYRGETQAHKFEPPGDKQAPLGQAPPAATTAPAPAGSASTPEATTAPAPEATMAPAPEATTTPAPTAAP